MKVSRNTGAAQSLIRQLSIIDENQQVQVPTNPPQQEFPKNQAVTGVTLAKIFFELTKFFAATMTIPLYRVTMTGAVNWGHGLAYDESIAQILEVADLDNGEAGVRSALQNIRSKLNEGKKISEVWDRNLKRYTDE